MWIFYTTEEEEAAASKQETAESSNTSSTWLLLLLTAKSISKQYSRPRWLMNDKHSLEIKEGEYE